MEKRTVLILFIQFLILTNINGQAYRPSSAKIYQSLNGEVFFLTLFVDTKEDYWKDAEVEHYLDELEKSQTWLQDQAAYYNQSLVFNNNYFFENNEIIYVRSINRNTYYRETLQAIMEALNYDDFEDFLEENRFNFKEQKLKILLFVKSYDRSHAYNLWSNTDVDLAIVYCKNSSGLPTDHYVISHEVLHQFGAWDLYYGESQSKEKAARAKELYPNSVMINTYYNKSEIEVDELTAWRVGWNNDLKEEYLEFKPVRAVRERTSSGGRSIKFDLGKKKKKN